MRLWPMAAVWSRITATGAVFGIYPPPNGIRQDTAAITVANRRMTRKGRPSAGRTSWDKSEASHCACINAHMARGGT